MGRDRPGSGVVQAEGGRPRARGDPEARGVVRFLTPPSLDVVRGSGARTLGWTVRDDGTLDGVLNMARDHALALALPPGSAVLRLYRWTRPTLSLGRNEPALELYDPTALRARGLDVVRRPTGGRAVLHRRELTYAVIAPARALGGARAAYRWINACLARGLVALGVPAEIAPDPPAPILPDAGPCFGAAAGGELTAGGRKLVGSAQVRIGGALLQHGSILVEDDQGILDGLAGRTEVASHPTTLREQMGAPPAEGVLERAVVEGFRLSGVEMAEGPAGPVPGESDLVERYGSRAWTWRR